MSDETDDTMPGWPRGAGAAAPAGSASGGGWPRSATAAVIVLLAIVAGLVGYLIGRSGDDETAAPETTTSTTAPTTTTSGPTTTATPPTSAPPTTAAPTTTAAPATTPTTTTAPATTAPATTAAPATTTTAPGEVQSSETTEAAVAAGAPERLAVFRGGRVYLRGKVPSEEVAAAITERAAAVVGPENVVTEYEIDPAATLPESAPLYVEDLVLFRYNSATIDDEFIPLLDLGLTLFGVNPAVTVEVIGHTDATGPAADNLVLSQRRVDAVVDYWVARGVDPARITGTGKGETEPLVPDDPTAAINRRIEFVISNILG